MLLPVFEKYFFLQSLGWGIANSLWQSALLWFIYQSVITSNKNLSALIKHQLSLVLLFASFAWFSITIVQNYIQLNTYGNKPVLLSWLNVSENFSASLQLLSVAYFGLLLVHGFRFIKNLKGLLSIKNSHFIKAPVDTRIFTGQTALHIGITKKVTIWLSEKVDVPSVIGFLKPMILLPVMALNNLTTAQAEAVILHELAHIKRNDYLVNLFQSFIELILFFNPFSRMLGAAARKERENCCDDWVLNYCYNKHDYAAALLVLEQSRLQSVQLVLTATNGKKNLLGRIKRLFVAEPQVSTSFFQRIKLVTVTITLLLAIFFVLPVIGKKTNSKASVIATDHLAAPPLLASLDKPTYNLYPEAKPLTIINDEPIAKQVKEKRVILPVVIAADNAELPLQEVEYNRALVNDELLNPDEQLKEISIQAADKASQITNEIIVKIEEEQSGIKDRNTYILQLKNANGSTEIKPLVIFNKKMKALNEKIQSTVKLKLADSLKTSVKIKTRITS